MKTPVVAVLALLAAAQSCQSLTLDELLAEVRAHHPLFRQAPLAIAAEEARRDALLPADAWQLRAGPSYTRLGEASAADYCATGVSSTAVHAEARRSLPTGGSLAISASGQYLRLAEPAAGGADTWKSRLGVTFEQPLLRGYGRRLERAGYDLARFDVEARRVERQEAQEALVLEASLGFVDWALGREKAALAERRLAFAQQLAEQTLRMRAANLVERIDVLRADDAVRAARLQVLEARAGEEASRAQLAVLASLPAADPGPPELALYSHAAPQPAAQPSRALRLLALPAAQLREQRLLAKERRRPELALTLQAGLAGRDESAVGALSQAWPDASIGLELALSAGHPGLDAEVRALDARIAALEAEAQAMEVDLAAGAAALRTRIDRLAEMLPLSLQQVVSAEEKTREELRLYGQGRGTLFAVLQSRDEEQQARTACAESHASYHQLMLEYRAFIDKLEA